MPRRHPTADPKPFSGFASPTSNTVYTPNQFFDVCLRYGSRGCIRVVAHLIRQTLGWSDRDGNPLRVRHAVSYADFQAAGIGKDTIQSALAEAIDGKFIRCVRQPESAAAGRPAVSGLYELRWDDRPLYLKDPRSFEGFYAGEGNRTFIPNAFFDHTIPGETLAVVKAVGAVIRFSIGFQTKWGHRRQQIALSYTDIQRYARIGSRATLSAAIKMAVRSNYLVRVAQGYFDPNGGRLSAKACYALRWLADATDPTSARKSEPAEAIAMNHSENRTGTTRKSEPANRSIIRTGIETTELKNISKQHADAAASSLKRLKAEGFDAAAAQVIASAYPAERIHRQLDWIERRRVRSNRLGMIRAAIVQDWGPPGEGNLRRRKVADAEREAPGKTDGPSSMATALNQARARFLGQI